MTNMQLEKSTAFQLLFESNIQFFLRSSCASISEKIPNPAACNSPVSASIASSNEHLEGH